MKIQSLFLRKVIYLFNVFWYDSDMEKWNFMAR